MLKSVEKGQTQVCGGVFRERMEINKNYLLELDSTALLQNFYLEAGIIMPNLQVVSDPQNTILHWGWEAPTCQLRGHFLGHWLSASALYLYSEEDAVLRNKMEHIIDELERCQIRNGGKWIGSIPEKYIEWLNHSEYIWSPQYTLHKTLMGLIDCYRFAGSRKALNIANHMGTWFSEWVMEARENNSDAMYKGEQGGMLELWAELFELTGEEKYQILIETYKENYLYDQLREGKDALTDDHANASIPLAHGSAKLYEQSGEESYAELTEQFWNCAVENRGYLATTGQNAGEFWIPPYQQGTYLGENTQEFCTVYNMVRLADYLYRWSGNTVYADYIERALYNGFLAQQNPESGTPTYFLPLGAGSRKKWGSKRNDFWCCHGTMVQAQALYPQLIYYTEPIENTICIAQYIPSRFDTEINGTKIHLEQSVDVKNYNNQVFFEQHCSSEKSRFSTKLSITCENPVAFTLAFRIPKWAMEQAPDLLIDGVKKEYDIENGYLSLEMSGSTSEVSLILHPTLTLEFLPDRPECAAILDGPIVLAGLTDSDCGLNLKEKKLKDVLASVTQHTYGTDTWQQNTYITRFQNQNFSLVPLYKIKDETYTVYYTIQS